MLALGLTAGRGAVGLRPLRAPLRPRRGPWTTRPSAWRPSPSAHARPRPIDALPPAHLTTDPLERADVLDEANALLVAQVDELEALVPLTPPAARIGAGSTSGSPTGTPTSATASAYPDALRADRDARFRETEKAGDHISEALEGFAVKNSMPSCAPTGDLG